MCRLSFFFSFWLSRVGDQMCNLVSLWKKNSYFPPLHKNGSTYFTESNKKLDYFACIICFVWNLTSNAPFKSTHNSETALFHGEHFDSLRATFMLRSDSPVSRNRNFTSFHVLSYQKTFWFGARFELLSKPAVFVSCQSSWFHFVSGYTHFARIQNVFFSCCQGYLWFLYNKIVIDSLN